MKVLLISVNNESDPYPVAPIGVAYIATALNNKGHDVRLLDLYFVENDLLTIGNFLKEFLPDVIGISIRNIDNLTYNQSIFYLPKIRDIVNFIKSNTSVPVIVGGSGFSIFPEEVLRYLQLDIGIVGEGENAFPVLVATINNGGDICTIPNICYIEDGEFILNDISYCSLDSSPDRMLLDNKKYFELGGMSSIQSKRGCPFECTYCTYPNVEGKTLRFREPGDIVEELREIEAKYGIDYVFFVDDIFNIPKEHAIAVCEEMIRCNLGIDWTCFATPKDMTAELAKLMKMAGCKGIEFGSDAGTEKTLRGLGKPFAIDDVARVTESCNSIDLPNAHYIIIGGPNEDDTTLNETFALFEKINPTAVIALIGARIYPNTLLFRRAVEDGVIEKDRNLLEPVFYLSPEIDAVTVLQSVSEYAKEHRNWIVPCLNIRCDTNLMLLLRKMGKKGPLWDML